MLTIYYADMIKPFISLFFVALCLAACAVKVPHPANEIQLTYISPLDENAGFAATPDGEVVACSHRGLKLREVLTGNEKKISTVKPDFLSWSTDGRQLAAATIEGDESSRLAVYSQEGLLQADLEVPAVITGLKWTAQGELLATGYLLKVYSFGSNLKQSLYRFAGEQISEMVLSDTTLKPSTSKTLAPVMGYVLPVHFSRLGDEMIYVRLHDPPEFPPYLVLVFKNLQAGDDKDLQRLSVQKIQIMEGDDEDAVAVLSREGRSIVRLWPKLENWRYEDRVYRFVDGRLTQDDVELANWGQGSHAQLLNDGTYLLGVNNRLYLGAGLQSSKAVSYNEKSWLLRRWRHEGLISNEEYYQSLKGLNP